MPHPAGMILLVFLRAADQGVDASQYRSTVQCVKSIVQHEGILAFWKGTAARLPRVVFGQSITLAGFDKILQLLDIVW